MTPQEIFTTSYQRVMAQGRLSYIRDTLSASNKCLYAGPENTGCAIGVLISREVAEVWDEQRGANSFPTILRANVAGIEPWMRENRDLLTELQDAHDNAAWAHREDQMHFYERNMRRVAEQFGLEMPQ